MMHRYGTSEQAFVCELIRVLGGDIISVRGSRTKELMSHTITTLFPNKRCYFVPGRNDNIFAKIAETLWMIAGRNDIGWLSYYLPRAVDYSDDGLTWRGAYGPRLRNWHGTDQLFYVLNQLNLDPFSRQAVISIWDPAEDTISVTKDRPCNNWLQFYARDLYGDGKLRLHMNITQRSCDILWGYSGIDTFSWSVLLQMMAYWTGYVVGQTNHFITSLHVYEQHWDRAHKISNTAVERLYSDKFGDYLMPNTKYNFPVLDFSTLFSDFDDKLEYIFAAEDAARYEPDQNRFELYHNIGDHFLEACYQMMFVYIMFKSELPWRDIAYVLNQMKPCDFREAALEYFTRDTLEILEFIDLTDNEKSLLSKDYDRF